MKVLFISSGKSGDVGHVVKNQGESLARVGIEIEYFTINSGFWGYIRAIPCIRRVLKQGRYDLVHAHYSFSAFAASLAGSYPIVVSLMGSDAFMPWPMQKIIKIFSERRWAATIVKTDEMKRILSMPDAYVIPNGVDTERFVPADKLRARQKLNLDSEKKIVLFISVRNRPEKNLPLAQRSVEFLGDGSIELLHISDTSNSDIPDYLNAADLLLLTSAREGGVNVIKEAMACNCPIVSTDVGDVRWVTSGTSGCFITGHDCASVADNIRKALALNERINGRERIFALGLDSHSVADRIRKIYGIATGRV
jgi:glycosyltransferase involved in cell wall biosynthesis